jgi:hypothetical protein
MSILGHRTYRPTPAADNVDQLMLTASVALEKFSAANLQLAEENDDLRDKLERQKRREDLWDIAVNDYVRAGVLKESSVRKWVDERINAPEPTQYYRDVLSINANPSAFVSSSPTHTKTSSAQQEATPAGHRRFGGIVVEKIG